MREAYAEAAATVRHPISCNDYLKHLGIKAEKDSNNRAYLTQAQAKSVRLLRQHVVAGGKIEDFDLSGPLQTALMEPTTIKINYPEGMSDAEKQRIDDKLNALFEHRGFASDAEMEQAVMTVVKQQLGMDGKFDPMPKQLLLERLPLVLSAVILVVGLCWRHGLG